MILYCSLATALPCTCRTGSCLLGVDVTSLLRKRADIHIGYGFSDHWSIAGEASIAFDDAIRSRTATEQEHLKEFANTPITGSHPNHNTRRLMVTYWPSNVFKGFNISTGIQTSSRKEAGCLFHVGYTFSVWGCILISTSARVVIDNISDNNSFSSDNIRIGINYQF